MGTIYILTGCPGVLVEIFKAVCLRNKEVMEWRRPGRRAIPDDPNTAEDRQLGLERYRRVLHSGAAGLVGRGMVTVVQLMLIPLAVAYLGTERYGVWVALTAVLAWLGLADLGLSNSLTNPLAIALGKNDQVAAQRWVASAWWTLTGIALFGILMTWWLSPMVNWVRVLGVTSKLAADEVPRSVMLALLFLFLSLPLGLIFRIQTCLQEGVLAHFWIATGQVAGLLSLLIVIQTTAGLPGLVLALAGATVLTQALAGFVLFGWQHPWLRPNPVEFRSDLACGLLGPGTKFFLINMAVLLNLQTDHLVIAWFLGAEAVTPYQVTGRLMAIAIFPVSVIFPAMWPALTDAWVRGELYWFRRAFHWMLWGGLSVAFGIALVIASAGEWIIQIWVGKTALPPPLLWSWMVAWVCIQAVMQAVACLLNATGQLRGQTIYGLSTAILNLILSIMWVMPFGLPGVIAATVVAYLIGNVGPAALEARWVLRRLSTASHSDTKPTLVQ